MWPRRAALTLALFFGSFTIVYGSFSVLGDLCPAFLSWGYVFGLLALAAIVVALLALRHAPGAAGRLVLAARRCSARCATLMHPWQGELLILLIVGGELVAGAACGSRSTGGGSALAALTVGLTVLPLLYYAVLGQRRPVLELARDASKHDVSRCGRSLLAILPLLIPALLAYRRQARRRSSARRRRRGPARVLILYLLSASALGATPLHAFQGITIPLAVLAVQGVASVPALRRLPRAAGCRGARCRARHDPERRIRAQERARDTVAPQPDNATSSPRDERDALSYLAKDTAARRRARAAAISGRWSRPRPAAARSSVTACGRSRTATSRVQAARDLFNGA